MGSNLEDHPSRVRNVTSNNAEAGLIVLRSRRDWYGDQRLGTFCVYLDGKRVAKIRPKGTVDLVCRPGEHSVRVRHWWYFSPSLHTLVNVGATIRLETDIPGGNVLTRMSTLVFTPWKALVMKESDGESG